MNGKARGGAVFLLVWLAALPLGAATITVNSDKDDNVPNDQACTLREAVQSALVDDPNQSNKDCKPGGGADEIVFSVGGTVEIAKTDDPINLSSDLTITGPMTISGGGKSRIFEVGGAIYLRLENLTLTKAFETGGGAALALFSGGSITEVVNCKFTDNEAQELGGGILNSGGDITIQASEFVGNKSGTRGGAIEGGGIWTIDDTLFKDNEANGGGAMYCTSGQVTVVGGRFEGNKAAGKETSGGFTDGGGALMSGCKTNVSLSRFELNEAEGLVGGGAIYLPASPELSAIEDTAFEDNIANGGGGVLCSSGTLAIVRSSFLRNTASGKPTESGWQPGGGAVMSNCTTTIEHSLFDNNAAFGEVGGGAVLLTPNSEGSSVTESVFRMNYAWLELEGATRGGGGALHAQSWVTIDRSSIADNTVHSQMGGGGILFSTFLGAEPSFVVNTTLLGNVSTHDDKMVVIDLGIEGKVIAPPPKDKRHSGAAISVIDDAIVSLYTSSLAHDKGASELFVEPGEKAQAKLYSSLIDATATTNTCGGQTDFVFNEDALSLQSEEKPPGADGQPTCDHLPPEALGSQKKSDGKFMAQTPAGQLTFSYTKPKAGSAADGGGSIDACSDLLVAGIDLLGTPRPGALCTVGAVELSGGN